MNKSWRNKRAVSGLPPFAGAVAREKQQAPAGGYYGHSRLGYGGGAGIGVGTILVVLLVAYMVGAFH